MPAFVRAPSPLRPPSEGLTSFPLISPLATTCPQEQLVWQVRGPSPLPPLFLWGLVSGPFTHEKTAAAAGGRSVSVMVHLSLSVSPLAILFARPTPRHFLACPPPPLSIFSSPF